MWRVVRNVMLATVLTALVWVFAEAESVRTRTVRLDMVFEAEPNGSRFIRVSDGQAWPGRVSVEVEGSSAALNGVEQLSRATLKVPPTAEGIPADPGEHTIDLRTLLRGLPALRGQGVTIGDVEPSTVRLEVDALVRRDLPVRVETGGLELSGAAEAKPGTVSVVMPSLAAGLLKPESAALAVVPADQLRGLTPGRRERVAGVAVRPPAEIAERPGVRVEPPVAEVGLTLRNRASSIVLSRVPVTVRMPAGELNYWTVTIADEDRFLEGVRVVGPDDLVERIQRDQVSVLATITLTTQDLEMGIVTKEPEFIGLPEALRIDPPKTLIRLLAEKR